MSWGRRRGCGCRQVGWEWIWAHKLQLRYSVRRYTSPSVAVSLPPSFIEHNEGAGITGTRPSSIQPMTSGGHSILSLAGPCSTSLSEWSGGAGLDGGEGETCCRCCSSALGFLWPWQWIPSMDGHGLAGSDSDFCCPGFLALPLVLALGPFPSSIKLLHLFFYPPPSPTHTPLSPHFTSPSPPLFSLSLLSPSLSPFSSPLPVPLQSIPPPLLQLLASLPSRLPCNNPSAAAAAAFSSERSRPLTPLSRLAYTTAEKKYTAPPPIPIPPPPPSPASFYVLASPPASTSRSVNSFLYLRWLLPAPARFSAGLFVPARMSFMTLIVRCGAARANHPTCGFARWSSRFFFKLCLNKKPPNI